MDKFKACAKKGGYQDIGQNEHPSHLKEYVDCDYKMLLDPKAWECCGKSEGWRRECRLCELYRNNQGFHQGECIYSGKNWQTVWHSFIDWIAEGKSIDSFFEELLANQTNNGVTPP